MKKHKSKNSDSWFAKLTVQTVYSHETWLNDMENLHGFKAPVPLSNVLYLAGYGNYTWFYMADGRRKLVSRTLSYYSSILPNFIRIHKSYFINPAYVLKVAYTSPESGAISMQNMTVLPIAKRRIREVHQALGQRQIAASHSYIGLQLTR